MAEKGRFLMILVSWDALLGGHTLKQETGTRVRKHQMFHIDYVSLFDHLEWCLRRCAIRYPINTLTRLDQISSQSKVYLILSRIPGLGMSCANSSPSATPVTRRVSWSSVNFENLPESERSKNNNPAGPRRLGAIPMKILKILTAIFPSAQRIALIEIINNKQVVPIQPKRRLNFARLLAKFIVFCMTIQFNQFWFYNRPPNGWR